jgi:cytochrome c biogenesis protein CcmG, thiol:disulfide interchange protein DsbE
LSSMCDDRRHVAAALSGALLALLTVGCGGAVSGGGEAGGAPTRSQAAAPTRSHLTPAPAYQARRMESTSRFRLADQRGQAVLLTSFAPWCGECRAELPQMETLHRRHEAEGLEIIGVSVDEGSDAASTQFAHRLGVTFDLVHDEDHQYQATFLTLGVPSSVLVDRAGNLVKVWQGGFDVMSPEPERLIQRALDTAPRQR